MKQSEIKELSTEELVEHIENKTMTLDKMVLSHKVSEIENPLCLSLLIFKFLSFHCNCRNPTKFLSDIAMENLSIR